MGIAVPGTANDYTVATSGAAATITGNKPTNTADGDLLVAFVSYRNSATTFTPPSGWTLVSSQTTGQSEAVYYKAVPSAAAETATSYTWSFTGGSARCGVFIFRVTGANLSSPLDATGTWEAGPTSSMVFPAVSAVSANAMLVACGLALTASLNKPIFTAPTGMTTLTQSQWDNGSASSSMWVGFEALSASGSTGTETAPLSPNANSGNGLMFTLAPIAGPTASFTCTTSPLAVSVDGSGSTAVSPATISSYDWDWGDSTTHGSGSTASHTYASAGTYTVTLTVTDSNNQTNSVSQSVTVTIAQGVYLYDGTQWLLVTVGSS